MEKSCFCVNRAEVFQAPGAQNAAYFTLGRFGGLGYPGLGLPWRLISAFSSPQTLCNQNEPVQPALQKGTMHT